MRGQSRDLFFINERTRARPGPGRSIKLGTTARAKPSVRSGPVRRDRQPVANQAPTQLAPVGAAGAGLRVGVSTDGTPRRWGSGEVGASGRDCCGWQGTPLFMSATRKPAPSVQSHYHIPSRLAHRRFLSFLSKFPCPDRTIWNHYAPLMCFCAYFG